MAVYITWISTVRHFRKYKSGFKWMCKLHNWRYHKYFFL